MKDYYSILGVNRSASAAEIKRAFRRLAVTYHPDKNPHPEAEQIFKEVNEAYEIIGDPEKKRDYDYQTENPYSHVVIQEEETQPRHRDPAYRRRPPDPSRKSEKQEIRELMLGVSRYTRSMLWISLSFCFFLLLDYSFPMKEVQATVLDVKSDAVKSRRSRGKYDVSMTVHTDKNISFRVDLGHVDFFTPGTTIVIHTTRLLGVTRRIVSMDGVVVPAPVNIYGNFLFAPLTLAAAAVTGLIFRKRIELSFNLGVASFLVFILVLVLVLLNL